MTTVTQIITDAFRQSNLLAIGATPTDTQNTEALRYLNRLVKSIFGNEAGEPLIAFPFGNDNISRPSGYPFDSPETDADWFVPANTRLMLNLTAATSLYLHPAPDDGARFALLDIDSNLSTYPVTVYGNGRTIDGAKTATYNTDGLNSEWFYRADTGNWAKYATLLIDDTFPFPEEFDDYFITLLAMRLNPSYGITVDPQSQAIYMRAKTQFQARYQQSKFVGSEYGLIRMPRLANDRDQWTVYWPYDPTIMFDRGRPW